MGKAVYLDCFSGISGNMFLGALIDAGLPLDQLKQRLQRLSLPQWELEVKRAPRQWLMGTTVRIHVEKRLCSLSELDRLLALSSLSVSSQEKVRHICQLLATARQRYGQEAIGGLDTILAILGTVVGLELLEITDIFAGPLPLGSGWKKTEQGWVPIPSPVALSLLIDARARTVGGETPAELVTATGAALLAGLARFQRPKMRLSRIGYGFGMHNLARVNALRVWIGTCQVTGSTEMQTAPSVSSAPMASAPMRYTSEGLVAWDEMWTDFCALARIGGPPHRGTLLPSVSVDEVEANLEKYAQVVEEIERGLVLTTRLSVIKSPLLGWVGVQCETEEMARWLAESIVAENVSARHEESLLFVPAGPAFRLEKEIKNVITAVTKTHHYWSEHR
jgi:hypothetical protein